MACFADFCRQCNYYHNSCRNLLYRIHGDRSNPWYGLGVVLTYASIGIVRDSLKILSQAVPKDVDLEKVKGSLEAIQGVKDVHHIHAWSITPSVNIFSTHIHTDDLSKTDDILQMATKMLKEKFGFYFSTIQVEKECAEIDEASDIDITNQARKKSNSTHWDNGSQH